MAGDYVVQMGTAVNDLDERLELALAAAREAGRHTLKYFQCDNYAVERKADDSPVTVADREAELLLRQRITDRFPDDAILGEEFPDRPGTSAFRWILDPIDGTQSFIAGVPLYSVLIGVEKQGEPAIGVIVVPALDEAVWACTGGGAWYARGNESPRRAHVSSTERLAESRFLASSVEMFRTTGRTGALAELESATRLTRTWGDAYGYLLVATGRADLMVDPIVNVWDAAALLPVLVEAGGTLTDWTGRATIHGGDAVATNGKLLAEVLSITRKYPLESRL
ncbi:MAG: histidinol-phosphatase [Pirellulales bacterium]